MIDETVISINGLTTYCVIGANGWERNIKQKVVVDINLWVDESEAINSDMLEDALNYKKLKDVVLQFVSTSSYNLIEALAFNIAKLCLKEDKVKKVKVKVSKPGAISYAEEAAFEITLKK
ncbi:MAG: dihydroneopterin aldolase [Conexivisphaerales archaeon]